jgi:flavin-binding protein dodecin
MAGMPETTAPETARARPQRRLANETHSHRTAKVIEIVSSSTKGFEDAIRNGLVDARQNLRGITGAHVQNLSVRCDNGQVVEYKVDLKVAFGIERTERATGDDQGLV